MRVITGIARGHKLKSVVGNDVRPTTDKVKEAVFSSIQFEIINSKFLDLFSGSGQMGIEALSRGASISYFVDKSKVAINVISENINSTGFSEQSKIINMTAEDFIKTTIEKFDLVFLDPPYHDGELVKVLPLIAPIMNLEGKLICEHDVKLDLPEIIGELKLQKRYKYGKIAISKYQLMEGEE